jgi:hypothetical protein
MSYSIGGIVIADMEFTRSWGLSPASASITGVGAGSLVVGGDVILTIGASSFYGVLSNFIEETQDGQRAKLSFVDNRVKLMWDVVFCLFNRVEVRADNPATPGIDRQKRYAHILPENAETQLITYTTAPLTAEQIIGYLFSAPTLSHSWNGEFDAAQAEPVHEIDALTGKKLGNVLQEISDAQGLLFTLVGENTLFWARKGDGGTPGYDPASTDDISDGEAISLNDTEVTVVGDRNRYQDLEVDLEPDWNSNYEDFWLEADWHDNLSGILGLGGDFASEATLAAKMRSFTVRELVAAYGTGYADYGMWGEVSRMEIPVWTYLHDIVYKAYRIPRDYVLDTEIGALPLSSLDLVEGLLCAINYDLGGGMSEDATELYPDAKAFLLVKGQQLGLLDPTKQRVLTQDEINRQGTEFAPNNRFNLDTRNKTIIFQDPVFISSDLFIFLNQGTDAPDSLQSIAVPNAGADVSEAEVKAALVWDAERYKRTFGSGERKGAHYAPGLSEHVLSDGTEVTYADSETADEKATILAESLIAQQWIYESGGFKRNGATGTVLTGAIDRVTVSLTFDGGITERVEFSKERAQSNFEAERDLERKQRSKDLFPGQRQLTDDAKELNLIAKVSKELKRSPLQPVYGSLAAAMEKPVGAPDCSVAKIYSTDTWDAGHPVFLGTDSRPSDSGDTFAGIVIPDQATGIINCATQGIVPVRIKGPWQTNDVIGLDKGADADPKVNGERFIGRVVSEAYSGSDVILGMVQLGAGVGQQDSETPFQVVSRTNPDTGLLELGVISNSHLYNSEDRDTYEEDNSDWGLLDDDRLTGWFGGGEIDVGSIGDKIWLKITLDPGDQSITAIDVEHGPAWDGYPDPININDDDPANAYQQFYYQIIAEITDPDEDPRPGLVLTIPGGTDQIQVTQLLYTNLMMTTAHTTNDADQAGIPLLVAIPWNLPGTSEDGAANEIPPEDNLMTPWALGVLETLNDYAFEMFNASDGGGAKVLILDGQVFGPNDDGNLPAGMGGDDYILDVANDDEVWLVISMDFESWDVLDVSIDHGPSTPDDDDFTLYVTIGYVSVDDSGDIPIVSPTNALCGDYVIPTSLLVTDDEDNEVDEVNQMNFIGGAHVEHDDTDANPGAVDVAIGLFLEDDDGHDSTGQGVGGTDLMWGIQFIGYNATVYSSDEEGHAVIKILPDPPPSGKFVLASIDGDVDWAETCPATCE